MSELVSGAQHFNGDYKVKYIYLKSIRHKIQLEISSCFASMDIYEGIYTPFMTIRLELIDNLGLIDNFRVIGDEFIEFYVTDTEGKYGLKEQLFFIYKMGDRTPISDRGASYTMWLMSTSALMDINTKISKAYSGTPDKIAENIMKSYIFLETEKKLYFEECKHAIEYISPYWSPIRNIKYLCDRAVSKESNSPAFVFYESKDAFIFSSINKLIEEDSVTSFLYTINTDREGLEDNAAQVIEKLYVDESFDYIKRVKTGALGVRTLFVNPMTKRYEYKYYDFVEAEADFARLNKETFVSVDTMRRIHGEFSTYTAPSRSMPSMSTENANEWVAQSMVQHSALNAQVIQIDVSGRFNLNAGNVIDIYIYTESVQNGDNLFNVLDSVLSGRYMITALSHHLDRERHYVTLQLQKDSLITHKTVKELLE